MTWRIRFDFVQKRQGIIHVQWTGDELWSWSRANDDCNRFVISTGMVHDCEFASGSDCEGVGALSVIRDFSKGGAYLVDRCSGFDDRGVISQSYVQEKGDSRVGFLNG